MCKISLNMSANFVQLNRMTSLLVICVLGLATLGSTIISIESNTCKHIFCSDPPSEYNCTVTTLTNKHLLQKLGNYKDCCPAWICADEDTDEGILFLGISGHGQKEQLNDSNSHTNDHFATEALCTNVTCPIYTPSTMSCVIDHDPNADFELLHKNKVGCCPTMHCHPYGEESQTVRVFLVSSGIIPTEPNQVLNEKGIESSNLRCPNIVCGQKPTALENVICNELPIRYEMEERQVEALGSFTECCPTLWQCITPSHSTYNVYEIVGKTFWYYSTVFVEVDSHAHEYRPSCSNVSCPDVHKEKTEICTVEKNPNYAVAQFTKEKFHCCPVYSCTDLDGLSRISHTVIEGRIPTFSLPERSDCCKGFTCSTGYDNASCTIVKPANSSNLLATELGKIKDCCPVWECGYSDGSVYNKFEITGLGLHYKAIQTAFDTDDDAETVTETFTQKIKQQGRGFGDEIEKTGDTAHKENFTQNDKDNTSSYKNDSDTLNTHDSHVKEESRDEKGEKSDNDTLSINMGHDKTNSGSTGTAHIEESTSLNEKDTKDKENTESKMGGNDKDAKEGETGDDSEKRKEMSSENNGETKTGSGDMSKLSINTTKGTGEAEPKYDFDPGYCDASSCVKPQGVGECTSSNYTVPAPYPFVNCCPIQICQSKGSLKYYSITIWGRINLGKISGGTSEVSKNDKMEGTCTGVKCDRKPTDRNAVCSKLTKPECSGREALGFFHGCCDTLQCTLETGAVIRHYGIKYKTFRYLEVMYLTLPQNPNKTANATTTVTVTQTQQKSNGNQCKANEQCPKLACSGKCSQEVSDKTYVPEKESCCPLTHCVDENGLHKTHYVKYSGTIPTQAAEIEKQKGKSTQATKCSKILCGQEASLESKSCSITMSGVPIFEQIKPFVECCGMLKCTRADGSYFLQLALSGKSFTYFEISFYNIQRWESTNRNVQYMNSPQPFYSRSTSSSQSMYSSQGSSQASESSWTNYGHGQSSSSKSASSSSQSSSSSGSNSANEQMIFYHQPQFVHHQPYGPHMSGMHPSPGFPQQTGSPGYNQNHG